MFRYTKYLFFIALFMGMVACGDDSTGPDVNPSEAPAFPQILSEEMQPDFSFFEDNQPKNFASNALAETNNYYGARNIALANQFVFTFASIYTPLLLAGSAEEADFEDGMWVWEYSYNYENKSVSVRVTAEEMANDYEWNMYWSYNDGETSVEDYKILEGIISPDGKSGEWIFNTLDENTSEERIAYTSAWDITSDSEKMMDVNWYDENGEVGLSANYEANQSDHLFNMLYTDEPDHSINWNSETNEGYHESDGNQLCWDESFQDIACD
ncbi:hypothetical protein [Fodinibius sp.]|uniref:hypothetical protein n=1 Tax=Fodinibius sp. TaxID=1872440 RepID=UPI002ACE0D25|nr:hypothetical protein [Fodinibius sp.]MDZ7657835.1 hypothetical protein [Fodinibius sp.]